MNIHQFNILKNTLPDNIYGQKIGMVLVTTSGFNTAAKQAGYKKVTRYNVSISKKSTVGIINTSTGAQVIGATFAPLKESMYESEKLHGFLSYLKKNPAEKYITLRWDDDKANVHNTVYVDASNTIAAETFESAAALGIFTPSYIKSITEGYGRTKVLKTAGINVITQTCNINNIAVLRVAGQEIIDPQLQSYLRFVI